jgi:hypothetical protein
MAGYYAVLQKNLIEPFLSDFQREEARVAAFHCFVFG